MSLTAILILLITGIIFGIWITLNILRHLGKRSNKSAVCQELFKKLTHYREMNYHIHIGEKVSTVNIKVGNKDSLEDALKQLGYKKDEILKAMEHLGTLGNATIGEQIKESLKYLGGN